jgi:hypothetical protein
MGSAQRTQQRARHLTAVKRAAAGRQAISAARRTHLGAVRAAVRTQIEESYRRRLELSGALIRLRRGLTEFRTQLRNKLGRTASGPPAAATTARAGHETAETKIADTTQKPGDITNAAAH